jgi:HlyD family secretion protein
MKRWLIVALVVVVLGGGFLLLRGSQAHKEKATSFRMGMVDRGTVQTVVTASGTASAVTTVQVGSQVSGTIKDLYVDFNSPVHKGQVIARLDPTFLQAAVSENEASVEKAKASLTQAERDLARTKDLFDQNLAARVEYDNALTAVDMAKAGVREADAQLSRAKVNLAYSVITSPIDGIVISRNVDVGQTVAASLQAPTLFTIAQDLSEMQIETDIDEADIGGLQDGMEASFTVDSYPDEVFHGSIQQVRYAAQEQQSVVTYPVILRVKNPSFKLRPGMTANVTVVTARKEDVLRVPATALRFKPPDVSSTANDQQRSSSSATHTSDSSPREKSANRPDSASSDHTRMLATVWVKDKNGQPHPRRVRVGINDGSHAEVMSGDLTEGDSVIVGMAGLSAVSARTVPGLGGMPPGPGGGRR